MRVSAVLLSLALLFGAAAPPLHAAQPAKEAAKPPAPPSPLVEVTTAGDLLDRALLDAAGERLGTVRLLLADPAENRVRFLLIAPAKGDTPGALQAVPWEMLSGLPGDGTIRSTVVRDAIAKPPLFVLPQLGQLTLPQTIAAVRQYYTLPGDPAAKDPAAKDPAAKDKDSAKAAPSEAKPHLLIGHRLVAALTATPRAEGETAGTLVVNGAAAALGDIDDLAIDLGDRGRIAFALLRRGGQLGLGQDWVPVPLAPLAWDAEARRWVLDAKAADSRKMTGHPRGAGMAPAIERKELQALYDRYDVPAYWR